MSANIIKEGMTVTTQSGFNVVSKKGTVTTNYDGLQVIPASLLKNISLNSVPSVIQEAIDKAKLDATTETLANSIITDLRNDIDSLEDGVYKKQYIDNSLTYLEQIIGQKVDETTVAAIADARTVLALDGYATTNDITLLNSRVGNSETSIFNLSETINTNDEARALQIAEVEASVNENLANYSDVLDLTVDEDGNVKAEAIETLSTEVGNQSIEIQETKTIAQDANGKWEANAGILITDNDGKITGIHAKANNDISEVVVSADKFKIESAIGTPFSVINGEIYNNGKVNFTKNPTIATKDDLLSVNKTLFTNTESDLIMSQAGTNLSLEIQNIANYTNNDSFTIETSLSYKDGCIFSFQVNSLDALTSSQEGQFFTVSLVDINTGTEDLAFSCFFYIDNTNTTIMTAYYASSALYQKYIDDNPGSDFYDAYSFYDFKKDENGDWKSIYESLNDIITFVYDDNNLIIQENGIERGRAEVGANKTYKATVTASIYKDLGSNDLKSGVNLEINKWDRYYNNTNLVSEIADVTQSLTALTVSTAQEQFSLNTKILEEAQERAEQDAIIDNKVTDEETARINAITTVQEEYKNYTNIVAKALADEVITTEEQAEISVAWDSVQSAKNRLANIETQLSEIDKVEDINWQTEVQNAINSDLTTIDGGKIVATQLLIDSINALGTIQAAELIADTIYGKKLVGSIIEGAVIRASYLDLNYGLRLLTDYIISISTYNANPSLYIDTVVADNQRRIPTTTEAYEESQTKTLNSGQSLYGKIWAWKIANVDSNIKARIARPTFISSFEFQLVKASGGAVNFSLKIGGSEIGKIYSSGYTLYFTSSYATNKSIRLPSTATSATSLAWNKRTEYRTKSGTFSIPIFNMSIVWENTSYFEDPGGDDGQFDLISSAYTATVTVQANSSKLPFDWNSGRIEIKNNTANSTVVAKLDPSLYINNMIG